MADSYHEGTGLLHENKRKKHELSNEIEKVVLKWENVNFKVKDDEKTTHILHDVSGFANPQEMYAIMGGSGSGKTSLLSIISNQLKMQDNFEIDGTVCLNNKKLSEVNSNYYIRYIPQESILFEFLTPYEFLKFTLSLKTNDTKENVKNRVDKILADLGLTKVSHTLIGDTIVRGLSGGEKKRVCIASELMLYPSVLILDEPTSGLDSFISKSVISMLKDVLSYGVTIIMTIHQPSYDIFQMFNRLMLIQEGYVVFQGKAEDSIDYFNGINFDVPKNINPPEFYMKILRIEDRNNPTDQEKKTSELLRSSYKAIEPSIWSDINPIVENTPNSPEDDFQKYFFKSLKWLVWREIINYIRNPFAISMKVGQVIVFIILFDLIFYQLEYDTEGVDNRRGVLIFMVFICYFIPNFTVSMNIAYERHIIIKELKEGLYGVASYFLTKFMMEIVACLIAVSLLVFCTYFVVDLNDDGFYKVINLYIIAIVAYFQGVSMGFFCGAISKTPIVANAMGATTSSVLMTFSGFFNDPESAPDAVNWIRFFTPFYFLRNAAFTNEFDDLDIDDDVYPEPEDKYNYDGTVAGNISISLIHFTFMCLIAYGTYRYQIYKMAVSSN